MTYGRCPTCGAPGHARERRPNGDTICSNGHKHPSVAFQRHEESAKKMRADVEGALRAAVRHRDTGDIVPIPAWAIQWILQTVFAKG